LLSYYRSPPHLVAVWEATQEWGLVWEALQEWDLAWEALHEWGLVSLAEAETDLAAGTSSLFAAANLAVSAISIAMAGFFTTGNLAVSAISIAMTGSSSVIGTVFSSVSISLVLVTHILIGIRGILAILGTLIGGTDAVAPSIPADYGPARGITSSLRSWNWPRTRLSLFDFEESSVQE
jgi:hypothetical protein